MVRCDLRPPPLRQLSADGESGQAGSATPLTQRGHRPPLTQPVDGQGNELRWDRRTVRLRGAGQHRRHRRRKEQKGRRGGGGGSGGQGAQGLVVAAAATAASAARQTVCLPLRRVVRWPWLRPARRLAPRWRRSCSNTWACLPAGSTSSSSMWPALTLDGTAPRSDQLNSILWGLSVALRLLQPPSG